MGAQRRGSGMPDPTVDSVHNADPLNHESDGQHIAHRSLPAAAESIHAREMSEPTGVRGAGASAVPRPRRRASADSAGQRRARGPQRRRWGAPIVTLALACAAFLLAACNDGGEASNKTIEYFPPGGVSEPMITARRNARLNLDHTVAMLLEAAGSYDGDTGSEDGVDEFAYHFAEPTRIRLSLDRFDAAPQFIALDRFGNEVARVTPESGDVTITLSGETTLRFVHPQAGDATAEPIVIFLRPILPDAVAGPAQANPNDVATLKAGKNCPECNLAGMAWNACPGGASLAGIDLSHADFTSANLACLTFQPMNAIPVLLTGAIFDDASLNQMTLTGVELTDARFSGTMFEITTFNGVTATAADFSNSQWANSVFGATTGSGSTAPGANFQGAQFKPSSCLSAYDLREADFTGASFDSTSSVHGTWFAGANLFDVTFDGTKFQYDATLPNCGPPTSCTPVTVPGLCMNCPCTTDLGCLELGGEMACVQNQGAVTLSMQEVCQRPVVPAVAKGVIIQNADLTSVSFSGADLTNSVFAANTLDHTTDFAGTILAGVDFGQEHLGKSVDLSGAFLSDTTNFTGAVLSDFPNSKQGVNLSCVVNGQTETGGCHFPAGTSEFKGANMQYAQLANTAFTEVNLESAMLDGAYLVGAKLNFVSLKGASLVGAHLGVPPGMGGAAILNGAYMINVDLTDADMRSVDFTSAHVYGAVTDALFVRTLLDSADFTNAILAGAVFTDASLPVAVFNGAQLVNANFDGATLSNAKFDSAYLQGADFTTAKTVDGMTLSNAAVSTTLTSQKCTLIPPGSWMYKDQDGIPYTFAFGATELKTDASVTCPNGSAGPCTTGDSLCPLMSGPFPPIPPCVPTAQYCYENCLMPPCFKDIPDPNTHLCPSPSNCQ
jgi:uncharacterized protein YjbI with pentapeptide repeats